MEMTARYDNKHQVIIIDSEDEGEVTTANVVKATGLALVLSEKHRCNLLLFDISMMREAQSVLQGFTDMKDMNKTTGLSFRHKCAVVYDPVRFSSERASFIETVVTNRPNPMLRMFRNREDALKWLKAA